MIFKKEQKAEEPRQKKKHKALAWFLVIICGIMALGSIPSFAMTLFTLTAVMFLPIQQIESLWETLLRGKPKWIRKAIPLVVFVIACCVTPVSNQAPEIADIPSTEIISIESTESASTESLISETETVIETEAVIETEETETASELEASSENKATTSTAIPETPKDSKVLDAAGKSTSVSLSSIPAYSGNAYVTVNDNIPFFTDSELTTTAFENYSSLDQLGRCGVAYANVCKDIMPTEERGKIGSVKPSGWHTVKYDIVSGKYLYNRCHLIGYQLSAENANTKNLITGTRYLNTEGMLPFENMVADYVKETGNHVLYRVTPMFDGNNLLASGVLIEAKSVEDNGAGILFNVFCYNVQPGITIDYATGDSALDGTTPEQTTKNSDTKKSSSKGASSGSNNTNSGSASNETQAATPAPAPATDTNTTVQEAPTPAPADTTSNGSVIVHITDTGSKYHNAGCRYLKSDHEVTLDEAKAMGLTPCSVCNPPQ